MSRPARRPRSASSRRWRIRMRQQVEAWLYLSSALFLFRQGEHIQGLAGGGDADFRRQRRWYEPRAAAAKPGGDRDVLPSVDRERNGEALHRGGQTRGPEDPAGVDVHRLEGAIEIADERHAAGGGEHGGEERRALLQRPLLGQRVHVERGQPADVAVGARHLVEAAVGAHGTAAARLLLDALRADRDVALVERND